MSNGNKIKDDTGSIIIGLLGLFLLLTAFYVYEFLFHGMRDDGTSVSAKYLCHIIFLGIPVLLGVGVAYLFWHRRKFGRAMLLVDKVPFRLGQKISGVVEIDRPLQSL